MTPLPPFDLLKEKLSLSSINGEIRINASYDEFLEIVRSLVSSASFDEVWYAKEYPDVVDAVAAKEFKSLKAHFIDCGYFEGRLPAPLVVNEELYLEQYPDVAEGIERGEIQSAQQHFAEHGYWEGRISGN